MVGKVTALPERGRNIRGLRRLAQIEYRAGGVIRKGEQPPCPDGEKNDPQITPIDAD